MATVEATIIPPITFMIIWLPGMKKNAADPAVASIGSSACHQGPPSPRGSSGGDSRRTSSPGTVGG